ncbi:hypothetical protein [Cupriavidus sp. TMH.W2]|uniref:hypothetical protein n=1 Tax=Cupriavidus sp. TMH.W2 TaxID=3434465 RepID=UPI003D77771A
MTEIAMPLNTEAFLADLARLKIPAPDHNTLMGVYDLEGDFITQAIPATDQGNERALNYLRGIFFTVTPVLKDRLQRRNMMIPSLKILVEIGKREGSQFARRLKLWDDCGQDGDDSRYIRLTLAEFLQQEAAGNAAGEQGNQGNGRKQNEERPGQPDQARQAPRRDQRVDDRARQQNRQPPPQQRPQQSNAGFEAQRAYQEESDSSYGEEQPQQGKDYLSHHIYGGKAAACFSADLTRSGLETVRIEAADSKGQRQYDWKDKVAIQLSSRELPLVLATLMQWLPKFEGKGHGANNEKWFTLENQPGKLYLSVNCKGKNVRGVPIMAGDSYSLCTLLMRQMLKNDPFLSSEALLTIVQKQAEMLLNVQSNGSGQPRNYHQHEREPAFSG